MIIGFIICSLFFTAFGVLGYKEYLKWCERKSDERCQQNLKRKRTASTRN